MHRPRTLLGERLNTLVQSTLGDVDVIAFCVPANEKIGPGDRFINEQLDQFPRAKKVAIVTKIDATSTAERRRAAARGVSELREWEAIVPVSAPRGEQLDVLVDELHRAACPSPTSRSTRPTPSPTRTSSRRIAELIREAALEGVTDELPHSIAVTIDDMIERDDKDLVEIYANLFVERDSQKGIIIGKGGARLQEVGATRARADRAARRHAGLPRRCASRSRRTGSATRSSSGRLGF